MSLLNRNLKNDESALLELVEKDILTNKDKPINIKHAIEKKSNLREKRKFSLRYFHKAINQYISDFLGKMSYLRTTVESLQQKSGYKSELIASKVMNIFSSLTMKKDLKLEEIDRVFSDLEKMTRGDFEEIRQRIASLEEDSRKLFNLSDFDIENKVGLY